MTTQTNDGQPPGHPPQVDFGFQEVDRDRKTGLVRDLFAGVANRYDVMNDAMSLGVHRRWKDAMVDWLAPRRGMQILDLAGGTGDIAQRILNRTHGDAHVTICDLTAEMIARGQTRKDLQRYTESIHWTCGDGAKLPFADQSFDACTIAFGLRNVTDRDAVLTEAFRVLRLGGRFLCLEFSQVRPPAMAQLYDLWSFRVIPQLGAAIARDRAAYQYLVESIRRFPNQAELAAAMARHGFSLVEWRDLTFGVVALHSGWRV